MLPASNPRSATNLASLLLQHSINIHSSICSITYLASHNLISSSTPSTFLYISTPGQKEYLEIPGMDHGKAEGTAEPWNIWIVTAFRLLLISQWLQFPSFPDQETEAHGRKRFCLKFTISLSPMQGEKLQAVLDNLLGVRLAKLLLSAGTHLLGNQVSFTAASPSWTQWKYLINQQEQVC